MDMLGYVGLLCVFLSPMVFGGITAYYSHKTTHKITMETWKYWRERQ